MSEQTHAGRGELLQIDAFTAKPFAGNPAAVCFLERRAPDELLQAIAAEMNLSETAFPHRRGDGEWDLRWFTPAVEVNLCGHATLAAAWALWETGRLDTDQPARFHTRSGALTADREANGWVRMNFPADPPLPCEAPEGLRENLGLSEDTEILRGREDFLVPLESEEEVRELSPNHQGLRSLKTRGVIVTATGDADDTDFVSRFFAPGAGIDEDPVTGSAHCTLAPFWAPRLSKANLSARQVSARGGQLEVTMRDDRVDIRGQAVITLRGELIL
jgi:PhzF family phenazine biosynthesis protein